MTLTINSFKDFFEKEYAGFAEKQKGRAEDKFNSILSSMLEANIVNFTGRIVVLHEGGQKAKLSKKIYITPYSSYAKDLFVSVKRFFLGVAFDKLETSEDFQAILQQSRRITVHVATDGSIAKHSYEEDFASLPVRLFHRIVTPLPVFFKANLEIKTSSFNMYARVENTTMSQGKEAKKIIFTPYRSTWLDKLVDVKRLVTGVTFGTSKPLDFALDVMRSIFDNVLSAGSKDYTNLHELIKQGRRVELTLANDGSKTSLFIEDSHPSCIAGQFKCSAPRLKGPFTSHQ